VPSPRPTSGETSVRFGIRCDFDGDCALFFWGDFLRNRLVIFFLKGLCLLILPFGDDDGVVVVVVCVEVSGFVFALGDDLNLLNGFMVLVVFKLWLLCY